MKPLIYGLILAGGMSRRMGQDKALLSYHDKKSQLEYAAELLSASTSRVFVSQRKDQDFPIPLNTSPIFDTVEKVFGPLRGILSAMQLHPKAHWLVLACDLPFLKTGDLDTLINAFLSQDTPKLTAYKSSYDGLPEPLCALYPSGVDQRLLSLSLEIGKSCPRKLLILEKAVLIAQKDPKSLDNINTIEEYRTVKERFD